MLTRSSALHRASGVLFVAALMAGCAGSHSWMPTAAEIVAQGITVAHRERAALGRGRALVMKNCASCHRMHWPHEYTAEQWPAIVRWHIGRESLSVEEAGDIELYLVTASRSSRSAAEPPAQGGTER